MQNRRAKVTLSMIVKNESQRYLRSVLLQVRDWIDEAVIIDDGSTDDSADICKEVLASIPLKLITNQQSQFSNEVLLRKQQWEETIATGPEWILNLDADEWMEKPYPSHLDALLSNSSYDAIYLRLFDMWSETQYRDDTYWSAHNTYRPFLVRYKPDSSYIWHEAPQHCGRFPMSIHSFPYVCHPCRIKHLGWSRPADRKVKYQRYMTLDPDAKYGWKAQYESILDENPHLVDWKEQYGFARGGLEVISISLCMIVKNEEQSLGRCLHSVREVADEIVIVDTGSTDRTKEIAESFGAKIYDFAWIDDFGAARNYSFSKATQEYVLWLDADDEFEEVDRQKLLALKTILDRSVDSVSMNYHLSFDAAGQVTSSLRRNRLVRRDRGFQWEGPVHEVLIVGGNVLAADIAVTHKKDKEHTDRNLRIYLKRAEAKEDFSPRDLYYFANELKDHAMHEEAIDYYERFLDTKKGWIEDVYSTCLKIGDSYGELQNKEQQIRAYLRALVYDKPRAEMCCRVGAYFLDNNALHMAAYWYETATTLGTPDGLMGRVDYAAWTWLPHLQLCLCYDRLGDKVKANEHNEKAYHYKPTHPSILFNRAYFAKVLPKETTE